MSVVSVPVGFCTFRIKVCTFVICSASSASAFVSPCTYDASHYIYMGKDAEGLPTGVKMQIV